MASLRTIKRDGTHQVRWLTSARKAKSRTFPAGRPGRRAAEAFKVEVEIVRAQGRDWEPAVADEVVDLEKLLEAYKDHQKHVRRIAPSTGRVLVIVINLFVDYLRTKHARGTLTPARMTRANVEGFYVYLKSERVWGRGEVKHTGIGDLTAYHHTSKVIGAWRWLHQRNPQHFAPPVDLGMPAPRPALRPRRHTWEECDRVIALAGVEWHRRLMVACRFTGLRVGQVMRLLWSDVDVGAATLTIRPELGKSRAEQAGRTVPIAPAFAAELAGWGKREGFLVTHPGKKRKVKYEPFQDYWEAVAPEVVQPFHGFRKAFEQELRRAKVEGDVRDLLVGHAQGRARGGDTDATYIGEDPLMPEAREAVALIPPIGQSVEAGVARRVTRLRRRT